MIHRVRLGLAAIGIGAGADRGVIDAVAVAAQDCGFSTLWAAEHVVMVDQAASRYPYSGDGKIAIPAATDWLDPLIGLSFAAAATSTINVATGILLLPEHNPVLVAKQAATLDRLSGGRLLLGVGIGWLREEFDALGVPFPRRVQRTTEYVMAIRTLWRDDNATFTGEFVKFDAIRVNPKPLRNRAIPIIVGGNSDAALRRAVAWGDGWYGFNLDINTLAERMEFIHQLCRDAGRDPGQLQLIVNLSDPKPSDISELVDLGINELVLVESPPERPHDAAGWVATLADQWMPAI